MLDITTTSVLLLVITIGLVSLTFLGVAYSGRTAHYKYYWRLALLVAVVLTVWLFLTACLAESGFLSSPGARPPRVPLLPLIALAVFGITGQTQLFRRLVETIPLWIPVGVQSFRVGVEYALWRLYREGLAPVEVTFEGWNFDALAGLSALVVAAGIAARVIGPVWTMSWNIFGLCMLGTAVVSVMTSAPGPFRLDRPSMPFVAIASWPVVWIPAFLAPFAVLLHLVSMRQSWTRLRQNAVSSPRTLP